ncbi:hypothetical protein [Dyella subtropica]|uniref:hypothetical protein n=1 Tax=Dyella subtropica TaxID=2992127 RepID=UPI002250812D|nr:hypothetical protein [Dyella subtropica]
MTWNHLYRYPTEEEFARFLKEGGEVTFIAKGVYFDPRGDLLAPLSGIALFGGVTFRPKLLDNLELEVYPAAYGGQWATIEQQIALRSGWIRYNDVYPPEYPPGNMRATCHIDVPAPLVGEL